MNMELIKKALLAAEKAANKAWSDHLFSAGVDHDLLSGGREGNRRVNYAEADLKSCKFATPFEEEKLKQANRAVDTAEYNYKTALNQSENPTCDSEITGLLIKYRQTKDLRNKAKTKYDIARREFFEKNELFDAFRAIRDGINVKLGPET